MVVDIALNLGSLLQIKLINVSAPPKQDSPKNKPRPPPRADSTELLSWM